MGSTTKEKMTHVNNDKSQYISCIIDKLSGKNKIMCNK